MAGARVHDTPRKMTERERHRPVALGRAADAVGYLVGGAIGASAAMSQRRLPSTAEVAIAASAPWFIGVGALAGAGLIALGRPSVGERVLGIAGLAQLARWSAVQVAARPARAYEPDPVGSAAVAIRLVSVNLWNGTRDVTAIGGELSDLRADLVILQEVTPRHLSTLEELGTFTSFVSKQVRTDTGHAGLGLWSRLELSDAEWFDVAGEPQLRAWAEMPNGGRLRIYAVHAPSPVPRKIRQWRAWFHGMAAEVSCELSEHEYPIAMAGDFNATSDHRPFRTLLNAGFADAVPGLGRGWRMTWPTRWWPPVPALFRLDHVLLSGGIGTSKCRVGRGRGSDHRPLIVDLRVLGRRKAAPTKPLRAVPGHRIVSPEPPPTDVGLSDGAGERDPIPEGSANPNRPTTTPYLPVKGPSYLAVVDMNEVEGH